MSIAWVAAVRRTQAAAQDQCWREALRLAAAFRQAGAVRVILFGSVARGDGSATSDVDLAVVMPHAHGQPVVGRGHDILLSVRPAVPVDLVIYSPEEWEQVQDRAFVREEVLAKGRDLIEWRHGS